MALSTKCKHTRIISSEIATRQLIQRPTGLIGTLHGIANRLLDPLRQSLGRQQLGVDLSQAILEALQLAQRLLLAILEFGQWPVVEIRRREL